MSEFGDRYLGPNRTGGGADGPGLDDLGAAGGGISSEWLAADSSPPTSNTGYPAEEPPPRNSRKNARMASANSRGSSSVTKCPPRGNSAQRRMSG